MYVVCSMYVVICKIDHCIHIHWCIPMGLGHNDPWVESHMWPQQMWGQRSSRGQWPLVQVFAKRVTVSTSFFCKKGHRIHILWCIFMGLGHNDPWAESHIRPQQMWGQRSSRGQWPLVQVFTKTVTVSTYFDIFSGETHGSRTTLLYVTDNSFSHSTQGSKLTLPSSHFASEFHQTASAKSYHMHFSATRTLALIIHESHQNSV